MVSLPQSRRGRLVETDALGHTRRLPGTIVFRGNRRTAAYKVMAYILVPGQRETGPRGRDGERTQSSA